MLIDLIAIVIAVIAIFKGIRKGLIVAVFSFLGFLIGLAAAIKLSAVVAERLSESTNISQRWLPVLAFAIVFFIVVLLVRLGAKAIEGVVSVAMLGWLNRLGGVLFYLLLYFLVYSVVLFYAQQLNVIKPHTATNSITFSYLYPIAPKVIGAIGVLIPFFKDMFVELEEFFGRFA